MGKSVGRSSLSVALFFVLVVIALAEAVPSWGYGRGNGWGYGRSYGRSYGRVYGSKRHTPLPPFRPMFLPSMGPTYNNFIGFSPMFNTPQWHGPAFFGGSMFDRNWFHPPLSYVRPPGELHRNWGYPRIPRNQFRRPAFSVPTPTRPVVAQFTKAPVVQKVQKKPKISVLSGPLGDVRPFPAQNRAAHHHMKKKLAFKPVAKAKPFHSILSGTALGINKGPVRRRS